jgi:hypothetical protein
MVIEQLMIYSYPVDDFSSGCRLAAYWRDRGLGLILGYL